MAALIPMIINLIPLIPALIATVVVTVILLFLPAAIELKKPKDAGPRQITTNVPRLIPVNMNALELEGGYAVTGAVCLAMLQNVEI